MAIISLPPIPQPNVPVVDKQTGLVQPDWYKFLSALARATGQTAAGSTVVAGLSSTAVAGSRSFVTDATATTFHSAVAGGGANKVPVVFDGSSWLIG